jgi:hypothetical protein
VDKWLGGNVLPFRLGSVMQPKSSSSSIPFFPFGGSRPNQPNDLFLSYVRAKDIQPTDRRTVFPSSTFSAETRLCLNTPFFSKVTR